MQRTEKEAEAVKTYSSLSYFYVFYTLFWFTNNLSPDRAPLHF